MPLPVHISAMSELESVPTLEILTLGGLALRRGEKPVAALGSRKAEALLVYLAVHGRPLARNVLAELLWQERTTLRAQGNLRRVLYDLRQHLAPYLSIDRDTVAIRPDRVRLDVATFQDRLDQVAQQGGLTTPQAVMAMEEAVSLYRGPFLHGFPTRGSRSFEAWLLAQQGKRQQQVMVALQQLVDWYLTCGPYARGLIHADHLLRLDPYRETNLRQLLRLLAYQEQRAEALARYERARQTLWEELGVAPEAETIALYEAILAGELVAPETAPTSVFISALPGFLSATTEARPPPPFVAREAELLDLDTRLARALAGHGQVVFLSGEPGAGKTALAAAFCRRAAASQPELLITWGQGQAHAGVGDPYLPFRLILAMLTGDVETPWAAGLISREQAQRLWQAMPVVNQALWSQGPDLPGRFVGAQSLRRRLQAAVGPDAARWFDDLQATAGEDPAAGSGGELVQFFEQYSNVLATLSRRHPLLLILDDLQWADAASLDLLFHLSRSLDGSRILLLGAYRPEEVALGRRSQITGEVVRHPLQKVLDECQRNFGGVAIELDKTARAEGQTFVNALLDTEPNRLGDVFRRTLARHTSGQPLFTVELLRILRERGALRQDEEGRWVEGAALDWRIVPARVEGVIAERIDRLDEALREILTVASIEGEGFSVQVLAQVLGAPTQALVGQLSRELDRKHRLVGERGIRQVGTERLYRYHFRHSLFQQHLYARLGAVERELLHGQVGRALESLYRGMEQEIAAQLGWHFAEAGEGERAIDYLLLAGDRARALYANDEAIGQYERALSFLKERGDYERAARTLMKLGLTYHNAFAFRRAQQAYDEGFHLWQRAGAARRDESLPLPPHPLRVSWLRPETLDPALATTVYAVEISDLLFSGLVQLTPELDLAPDVAHRWELLDGGRGYLFRLRRDVVWSDGVPVTAADFEFAWKRALDPRTNARFAVDFYPIKGAEALHRGGLDASVETGIRAVDDFTLWVELEQPTSYFPFLLTLPIAYPVPRHIVEARGEDWARMETIVTNGPFRLTSWDGGGEVMTLTRNPNYHLKTAGNVEDIVLFMEQGWWDRGWSRRLARYARDELDIIFLQGGAAAAVERARARHAGDYLPLPMLGLSFLQFDIQRRPFDDVRVRRAFVMAIDKEAYVLASAGHVGAPAWGSVVPPNMPGHVPDAGLSHDPTRARRLLAEAGFPGGRGFPDVALVTAGGPPVAQLLSQWQEQLGVTIRHESVGWDDYFGNLRRARPHIVGLSWTAEYLDPRVFLSTKDIREIWPTWHHEAFARLEARAAGVIDQAERIKLYQEMDRLLVQEAVMLPLNYTKRMQLVKPWVTGLPVSPIRLLTHCRDAVIVRHGSSSPG